MTDPLLSEPFLSRPAPRCLTRPSPNRQPPDLTKAAWPMRLTFERWAARLLRSKSHAVF